MKKKVCVVALVFSVGCATAVFRPYVGEQQSWPTSVGSIVNTRYDLPIFTSLPPATYDVLGELRIESPFYAQPEEGHMPVLVKKAREMGADAIVFVEGRDYFKTPYGPRSEMGMVAEEERPTLTQVNRFLPESFRPGVNFVAIKWLHGPPPGLAARVQAEYKALPMPEPMPEPALEEPMAEPVQPKAPAPAPAPRKEPTTNFGPS